MARSAIALLLAAAMLVVAASAVDTPKYLEERETAILLPVSGKVQDYLEYDKLREFCATMKAKLPIQLCEIWSIAEHKASGGATVDGVTLGVYFFTNESAAENITGASVATADKATFVGLVNTAFPLNSNVGGVIRIAAATFAMPRRADTVSTIDATPTGGTPGSAPAHFTTLAMSLRFFYTAASGGTPLGEADLLAKLKTMPLLTIWYTLSGSSHTATVDGVSVTVTTLGLSGYFDDRFAMQAAVEAYLKNSTVSPTFNLLSVIDVTDALGPLDVGDYVGDALTQEATPPGPGYLLNLFFTSSTPFISLPADPALPGRFYQVFFPMTEFVVSVTPTDASPTPLKVQLQIAYAADVVRALQIAHDLLLDSALQTAILGGVTLTGITEASIDQTTTKSGNSFRIPTTDFPLEQRFLLQVDTFAALQNNTEAIHEICDDFLELISPNVTACKVHMLSNTVPTNNTTVVNAFVSRKFQQQAVDGSLELVLTANNASSPSSCDRTFGTWPAVVPSRGCRWGVRQRTCVRSLGRASTARK